MEAFASGISSAVHGASASVDTFARHRRLDAACTDEDKVAPGACACVGLLYAREQAKSEGCVGFRECGNRELGLGCRVLA
jgi:hypothetical protein